ncbi:hypothetical protein C2845_PM16G06540 [Panicum miliaceum]|uniref:Uncharacterized protein n=1 Tax=Panicum miliaceum TaxID=4540 RepID=A0A3L6PW02_PANMI|nr:hypothetical protein C2845_PM16G06540 [Panicum miliaceum]
MTPAQPSRSATTAARSTRSYDSRARGCARGWRRRGGGTPGRCWPPRGGRRRGARARRRPSWSARSGATRSSRRRRGRWAPSARRGWASPGATRPSPRASAPPSTSSSSGRPAAPPPRRWATAARPRTRGRAASRRRRPRATGPRRRCRAGRAAAARRACCCSRAGTCACAARARPARTRAPSARPPRTPRSLSWSPEAYSVRPCTCQDRRSKGFVYSVPEHGTAVLVHPVHAPLECMPSGFLDLAKAAIVHAGKRDC